jgi:hypothetical protein
MKLNKMDNSSKTVLFFIALIVAAVIVGSSEIYLSPFGSVFRPRAPQINPMDLEFYYIAQTLISTINVALVIFLLFTYTNIYRRTRSEFTIGLIIFSTVLLTRDLAANPVVTKAFGFVSYGLGPFALLPALFEFVALSIMIYLTVE